MIFMTYAATASTTETTLYEDITYPQRAHVITKTYARAKSGLSYPAHNLLSRVITPTAINYVHDNPVPGKTAFYLLLGTKHGHIKLHDMTIIPMQSCITLQKYRLLP